MDGVLQHARRPAPPEQTIAQTRPVWAEVSRGRLRANYRALQSLAPEAELLAVVKADAYGHGAALCAPALVQTGACWLGVTCVEEGARLRAVLTAPANLPAAPDRIAEAAPGPRPRILVMSSLHPGEAAAALDFTLTPVIWEPRHLELLEAEAMRRQLPPCSVPVHLELDTGMARQGVPTPHQVHEPAPELSAVLRRFHPGSRLRLEAVMTHFHSPEVIAPEQPGSESATAAQIRRLEGALERIRSAGLHPPILSAGNSATILANSDRAALQALALHHGMRLMLRPGLALYGYAPAFTPPQSPPVHLQPVLAWKTRIVSVRDLPPGAPVGYNATFHTSRPTRLALLPVGYADGYSRLLSNRGSVLIRGCRAPIAGRISMDQSTVDVTEIPDAAVGGEAVLLGRQGDQTITAEEIAWLANTIPYEILCAISARVPRVPVDEGPPSQNGKAQPQPGSHPEPRTVRP